MRRALWGLLVVALIFAAIALVGYSIGGALSAHEAPPAPAAAPEPTRSVWEAPMEPIGPVPGSTDVPVLAEAFPAEVDKVVDGDTLWVILGTNDHRVKLRLLGLDTPEIFFGAERCGRESSEAAKELLHPGDHVKIIHDDSQAMVDDKGRLLVFLWLDDGTMFNQRMVELGWSTAYLYPKAPQPHYYADDFARAEQRARAAERGLWDPNPNTCEAVKTA